MFPSPLVYILLQQLTALAFFVRVQAIPNRTVGFKIPGL
jgi:hypothetical protein